MVKPTIQTIKKYAVAIKESRLKYLTCDDLSTIIGIYPDIISDHLAYFDPMIKMDMDFNVYDLLPTLEEYCAPKPKKTNKKPAKGNAKKKEEKLPYKTVNDFVYNKMSFGGMINRDVILTEHDLNILKRIINKELENLKK